MSVFKQRVIFSVSSIPQLKEKKKKKTCWGIKLGAKIPKILVYVVFLLKGKSLLEYVLKTSGLASV